MRGAFSPRIESSKIVPYQICSYRQFLSFVPPTSHIDKHRILGSILMYLQQLVAQHKQLGSITSISCHFCRNPNLHLRKYDTNGKKSCPISFAVYLSTGRNNEYNNPEALTCADVILKLPSSRMTPPTFLLPAVFL